MLRLEIRKFKKSSGNKKIDENANKQPAPPIKSIPPLQATGMDRGFASANGTRTLVMSSIYPTYILVSQALSGVERDQDDPDRNT